MEDSQKIGIQFKEEREKQGITLEEIYRKVRIHPKMVEDLEAGRFEKHGELYVKSFLKKYADFLGLDSQSILRSYEALKKNMSSPEFELGSRRTKKKKERPKAEKVPKRISFSKIKDDSRVQSLAVVVLASVLAVLFFILLADLRKGIVSSPRGRQSIETVTGRHQTESETTLGRRTMRTVSKDDTKNGSFTLTLEAEQRVWLKLTELGDTEKVIFVGFLPEGGSETWDFSGPVNIWTGKAEALGIVLDSNDVGSVADGVVKNIKVSSGGIQIGDKSVFSSGR